MGSNKRKTWLIVLLIVIAFVVAKPAGATFPGKNGKIAFLEGPDIFTINPDGSDEKQLTSFGSSGGSACCQAWSPNGRQLVFTVFTSSTAPGQLWIMNAEGSNQHQLFVDPASDDDESPTFSPDGSQIVFNRCHIPSGLSFVQCGTFRIEGDGTGLTAVSGFNSNPDVDDLSPVYSPDGKTIAVASFMRGGLLCAIYLMDANGSNIRQLTPAVVEAFGPDWSPDGEKIAFWTHIFYPRNTDSTEIGVINSDGTSLRLLTNPNKPFDFSPSWAPKGNALVFERDFSTTKFSIFLLNPDGSGSVELLTRVGMVSRSAAQRISRRTGERLAAKHHITLIDAGGFFPRWGSAPN